MTQQLSALTKASYVMEFLTAKMEQMKKMLAVSINFIPYSVVTALLEISTYLLMILKVKFEVKVKRH